MSRTMSLKKVVGIASLLAVAVTLTGCGISLVGKRHVVTSEGRNAWQVSVVNLRGFDNKEGKYLIGIYDSSLPLERSFSVLQLWSGNGRTE